MAKLCFIGEGGGASQIAKTIIPTIEKTGGKVLVGVRVSEIITEEDKAVGVYLDKWDYEIRAPIVLSGIGYRATFTKLLPQNKVEKYQPSILKVLKDLKPSVGTVTIFMGFKATSEELGFTSSTVFRYYSPKVDEFRNKYMDDPMNNPCHMFLITSPSAKDPTFNDRFPNKSTMVVMSEVTVKPFEKFKDLPLNRRGEEYEKMKDHFAEMAKEQIFALYPKSKAALDVVLVGTPLTINHYFDVSHGESFGLDFSVQRQTLATFEQLKSKTHFKGLYMCGQDTVAPGITTALIGGTAAASAILGVMNPAHLYQSK